MKQYFDPDEINLNERLRRSLDSMIDMYALLKPVKENTGKIIDFAFEYTNQAAVQTLGITRNAIIGKSLLELFPEHKPSGLLSRYINVVESAVPLRINSFKYDGVFIDRPFRGVYDIRATKLDDDIAVTWHDVTSCNELIEILTKQKIRTEILSELTEKLSEYALDYHAVLNIISERAAMLIGDGCVIELITDDGEYIECASLNHRDPEAKELLNHETISYNHRADESIIGEVILSGSTVFIPYVDKEEIRDSIPKTYHKYIDTYGIFSLVIVPLKAYGNVIGIMMILRDRTEEPYVNEDIHLFEGMAVKAALYIHNARLYSKNLQEVEERKRAEESLRAAKNKLEEINRELQLFAYATSHDLKEPLRMISGFLKLLEKRYSEQLDNKANEFISFAVDGAKRLNEMINDILEYSRIVTRGKEFEEIESSKILQITIQDLSSLIEESNAVITYDELPKIKADPTQLKRIFQNLISNAIKFNKSTPPEVHISCKITEQEWIFSVTDNGIGISKDHFENIFMLFKRLYPELYPGTGSGLAITKRIIDRHGGRIWVESEEGKGSTFFFAIPKIVNS